jgi:small subunit ribosomal protein S3
LGHKVHPIGFRLGVIKDWQSKWYSDTQYAEFVHEDNRLREAIKSRYSEAAISLIEIDRQAKDVTITLYTARPGIVIGRGGQRVDEMRVYLEDLVGKKIRLNIQEVRQPELDAYLVARSVAEQIERRIAYRRAMKQAIFRTIQAGAKGIKISCAGRLGNAEIARRQTSHQGQVPLHTLRADIDYGFTEAHTTLGRIGVKVWIYKGQILPELKVAEAEEAPAIEAEEKPAEAVAEEAPVAEPEEKPAEAVAEEAPVAEPEEKPVEAVAEEAPVTEPEEKPVEAVAEEAHVAKPEEKPTKTKAKKVTRAAATAKTEEKPAKATAAAKSVKKPAKAATTAKAAEKPEKPTAKKSKKTTTEAKAEAAEITDEAEPTTTTEEEAKDAAT